MIMEDTLSSKRAGNKLFGFRSGTPWKSGLALVYYVALLVFFVTASITPPLVEADSRDALLFKLSSLVLFLWLASPAVFLSDTRFRRYLPLFKARQGSKSLIGMFLVSLLFLNMFVQIERLHSQEYQRLFQAFIFVDDRPVENQPLPTRLDQN